MGTKKPTGSKFKITREDGRSNAQVLIDMVKDKPAGEVFTYRQIQDALAEGCNHDYDIRDIQGLAVKVYPRLLKEQARALHNIRNVGYRIAPAAYHVTLASDRASKADKQLLRGVQTLQNVRWDEMDQNQRMAHEGQLLIAGALYSQMKALERRQNAVEVAIKTVRIKDKA